MIQSCNTMIINKPKIRKDSLFIRAVFICMVGIIFAMSGGMPGTLQAAEHELFILEAPAITSANSAYWKSPDIKLANDFDYLSPATPDDNVIWWGANQKIYARFHVNGWEDNLLTETQIENIIIRYYYRQATVGETPPALVLSDPGDPSSSSEWTYIDDLNVTYAPPPVDLPFAIGTVWPNPAHFPSVSDNDKYIQWTAPSSGDYFHIRAEAIYPAGITEADTTNNVGISLYRGMALRDIDVVLLFDVSGSMGYYTYGGTDYITQAITRVSAFVASMNEDHKIAVVAFSSRSGYTGGYKDIWPSPVATLQPANLGNKTSVLNAVHLLTASGATPMGAGLNRAISLLSAGDPSRKRSILLLSDGYENTGTPRACAGADPVEPCAGETLVDNLRTNNIRVFSVALGTAAWSQCLECLANESEGEWYGSVTPGIDLGEVCLQMQQIISADDLYKVDRGVSGGGDDAYQVVFEGEDDVLYFILQWNELHETTHLEIRAPGAADWRNADTMDQARILKGKGYQVVRIEKPATGAWGYRVIGTDGVHYLTAVRSDRVAVRLAMDAESTGTVGSPINISAKLTNKGIPVNDANLTAKITIPLQSSLATTLRKASRDYIKKHGTLPVKVQNQTVKPAASAADTSLKGLFINKITDGKPATLIRTKTVTVPLTPTGDGGYTGVLSGQHTRIAGQYTVTVVCRDRENLRNFSKQLRMSPGAVDYKKSFAELAKLKTQKENPVWVLRTYPTDTYGNAVTDPSLLQKMTVKLKGAQTAEPFKIGFDSTFQRLLTVTPGKTPKLKSLKIGEKKIKVVKKGGKKAWKYGFGGLIALLIAIIAL